MKYDYENFRSEKKKYKYLQLIECFGFENSLDPFENNLENLLINYSNDKINNIFFDSLIKNELNTYEKEGLNELNLNKNKPSNVSDKLNNDILFNQLAKKFLKNSNADLNENTQVPASNKRNSATTKSNFSKGSTIQEQNIERTLFICEDPIKGIFSLINSQSTLIKNNKGLINNLIHGIKNNWPEISINEKTFILNHIGFLVQYGGQDFILRNTDFVKEDLKVLFKESFKNLIGLTIKNYNLNKENLFKYFNIVINFTKYDNNNNNSSLIDINKNENTGKRPRGSVYGKAVNKNKFQCENFLNKFKKMISSISNSDLSIIKLLKTGNEKKFIVNELETNDKISFNLSSGNKKLRVDKYNLEFNLDNMDQIQDLNNIYKNKFSYDLENKFILKQIYSSGILESVLLTKSGFFFRCDFSTLRNKLKSFKIFDDIFTYNQKENSDLNLIIDKDLKNLENNWTPNDIFVERLSHIVSVDKNDIVIGKTSIFLKNQAIIKNDKNFFFKLKDFPSLIIFNIFKSLMRKIINLNKFVKYLKLRVTINRTSILLNKISLFYKRKKFCLLILYLKNIFDFYIKNVILIQKKFRIVYRKMKELKELHIKCESYINKVYSILLSKMKKKFFKNLLLNDFAFRNITRIQAALRKELSHRKFFELKKADRQKKILLVCLVEKIIYKILLKKLFLFFFNQLKNFILLKQTKALILQNNIKVFLTKKRVNILKDCKSLFLLLNNVYNKNIAESKQLVLNQLKEILNRITTQKKINCISKISSLMKKNISIKKKEKLKAEKLQTEKILNEYFNCFKNIFCFLENKFFAKKFFKHFLELDQNLIKKTEKIITIQALIRKNLASANYKKKSQLNDNLSLFLSKVNKLDYLNNSKCLLSQLIQIRDQSLKSELNTIKIQSLIRRKKSLHNLEFLKSENNKKIILKNKLDLLISNINKISSVISKRYALNKIKYFHKIILRKIYSAIKLQKFARVLISKKKFLSLKKIKKEEKIKLETKLKLFYLHLDNFNYYLSKNLFLKLNQNIKSLACKRTSSAINLQKHFRKLISNKKFKLLLFEKNIKNFMASKYKKNLFVHLKIALSNFENKKIKCALTIQNLFRKTKAKNIFIMLQKEERIKKVKFLENKLNKIFILKSFHSKYFCNKIKKEFLNKLALKNNLLQRIIKIQNCFKRFLKLKQKKILANKILKGLIKLNTMLILKIKINKNNFLKQLKQKQSEQHISEIKFNNQIKKIQQSFRNYLKIEKEKEHQIFIEYRKNKLNCLIKRFFNKQKYKFLHKIFLKFKHHFKILKIIKNFCSKLLHRFVTVRYFKKMIFKTLKNNYLFNKQKIHLRKLAIRSYNSYVNRFKNEFISIIRVSSKYFKNKQCNQTEDSNKELSINKYLNIKKNVEENYFSLNTINTQASKNNTESTKNIHERSTHNFKNTIKKNISNQNLNPRLSAKIKSSNILNRGISDQINNEENNEKIKIVKIEKFKKKNSLKDNPENDINKHNTTELKKSTKLNSNDLFNSDFNIDEYKRFKLDKNLFKNLYDEEEYEYDKLFKYNAANKLISKYSRASYKINSDIANEKRNSILTNTSKNDISLTNSSKKLNNLDKLINLNSNNSMINLLDNKINLNSRKTAFIRSNTNLNIFDKKGNSPLVDDSKKYGINKKPSMASLVKNDSNNNKTNNDETYQTINVLEKKISEVPSYRDLIDMSTNDYLNNNISQRFTRNTVASKPINTLNLISNNNINNTNKTLNKNNNSNNLNNNNNNNKKVIFKTNEESKYDLNINKIPISSNMKNNKEFDNKKENLFNFNVNKNCTLKKNDSNKKINFISKNDKNQSSSKNINERIEAVFKNLDKLTLLNNEKLDLEDITFNNNEKDDCISEGSQNSNFQRVCLHEHLNNNL